MTFPTGIRAAKARLRDLNAEEKRLAAEEAAKADKAKALAARIPKPAPVFLVRVNGDVVRCKTSDLRAWGLTWGSAKPDEVKRIEAALRDGSEKVEIGGGSSALSRLVKRLRWPYPHEARRLASLDRRIATLQRERDVLVSEMGDLGYLRTLDEVAASIIKDAKAVRLAAKASEDGRWGTRKASDAAREAERLTVHVSHLESKSKEPCPCQTCEADRTYQARERELDARAKAAAKARAQHARHARFRAGCVYCAYEAHEDDQTRYGVQGMTVIVSVHNRPKKGCARCDKLLDSGYTWVKGCKVPEPPTPEEVAEEAAFAAANEADEYGTGDGEVEADEVEDGEDAA